MEVLAKRPWGYVEPFLSVTLVMVVGVRGTGDRRTLRMTEVLFQPQAKGGKLAVKESHAASMSRGGILSSPATLRRRGGITVEPERRGCVFPKLLDARVFDAVNVNPDFGCVEWPGGVDLWPDTMH